MAHQFEQTCYDNNITRVSQDCNQSFPVELGTFILVLFLLKINIMEYEESFSKYLHTRNL
jgi:hypothetical protein